MYVTSIALSLLTSGLFAGLSVGIAANRSVAQLSSHAYVEYWQAINRDYGRLMPGVFVVGLTSTVMMVVLDLGRSPSAVVGSVIALASMVITIALTFTVLVPLNIRADGWTGSQHPPTWSQDRDKWRHYHAIRTAVALAGFAGTALVPLSQLA
ncbi:hypothetical protein NONO_c10670 [Nocardia nova SH22a]|uniref:DUF1772 domain-containing protein n=1 Tax=Nocardia nova SH22a TaxID=1415166 RepID=W5T9U9_9NOCA|nr:DUF1772 domain-containing protein [Nocardia nova]AHH15874.1 hypothetical protein NONO_c10670 [Nocardia nova SH22a]